MQQVSPYVEDDHVGDYQCTDLDQHAHPKPEDKTYGNAEWTVRQQQYGGHTENQVIQCDAPGHVLLNPLRSVCDFRGNLLPGVISLP